MKDQWDPGTATYREALLVKLGAEFNRPTPPKTCAHKLVSNIYSLMRVWWPWWKNTSRKEHHDVMTYYWKSKHGIYYTLIILLDVLGILLTNLMLKIFSHLASFLAAPDTLPSARAWTATWVGDRFKWDLEKSTITLHSCLWWRRKK